jgi:hypothetical protein
MKSKNSTLGFGGKSALGFGRAGLLLVLALQVIAQTPIEYKNDFEKSEVGKPPAGMLILDGAFAVQDKGTNKVLELPGAPLETYGILFGTSVKEGCEISARFLSTGKGRRFPTFAVGLGGASGHRLQVSPAKKQLELFRGDNLQKTASWDWPSGQWTQLRLQIVPATAGGWNVRGKAWKQGTAEPTEWLIENQDKEEPKSGRPMVFGCPFAGTPIAFDDFAVRPVPSAQ